MNNFEIKLPIDIKKISDLDSGIYICMDEDMVPYFYVDKFTHSGSVIYKWKSERNFDILRGNIGLPVLRKGMYKFNYQIKDDEEKLFYIKIVYNSIKSNRKKSQIVFSYSEHFNIEYDLYDYEIMILSASPGTLHIKDLKVEKYEEV